MGVDSRKVLSLSPPQVAVAEEACGKGGTQPASTRFSGVHSRRHAGESPKPHNPYMDTRAEAELGEALRHKQQTAAHVIVEFVRIFGVRSDVRWFGFSNLTRPDLVPHKALKSIA